MAITNEFMQEMLTKVKPYTAVILKDGTNDDHPDKQQIIWEHGRRNFELRQSGKLAIVCPVADNSIVNGIGIFTTDEEETRSIMNSDPAVRAGIFVYEMHPVRSFPGDILP